MCCHLSHFVADLGESVSTPGTGFSEDQPESWGKSKPDVQANYANKNAGSEIPDPRKVQS